MVSASALVSGWGARRPVGDMKIAVVHEWLASIAGSERVVEQILELYPSADLFCTVDALPATERGFLRGRQPRTTFIQRLPWSRTHFRAYLPLLPLAIEQLDFSGYDLVISSNHAVAKGIVTGPNQLHISYVHSPMRYAWDMQQQYLTESGIASGVRGAVVRAMLHYLRNWDAISSARVDAFVANSQFVANRIRKFYRRGSTVIHPPVDVARFPFRREKEDFYVVVSRHVAYKRVPLIVEAFARMPSKKLVVIGDGPERARVIAAATPNVTVLGHQPTSVMISYLQRARAFVFAAEEDFGIAPVEAQACGTPVIAYGRGGALESIVGARTEGNPPTGLFFPNQTPESIIEAVERFEVASDAVRPEDCRARAERFAPEVFRARFKAYVERRWAAFDSPAAKGAS
jgi:glycosyltransferase involved in cell wall biosynthesis